jgi:hypothetical protein
MAVTKPPNVKVEPQATLAGETPQFLSDLYALARAFPNLLFDVFSGFRTEQQARPKSQGGQGIGFLGDPHTRGIAADINVSGRPIGQVFSQEKLASFGLMSGNTPTFYKGRPDPAHVQLGTSGGRSATGTSGAYAGRPAPAGLQSTFAADIAKATGLDYRVLFAWAGEESAYGPHGTGFYNFLNIKGTGSAGKSPGGFARYGTLTEAEQATERVLAQPNMRGIMDTAFKPAGQEIAAIQASPWDQTHEPALQQIFDKLYGKPSEADYLSTIGGKEKPAGGPDLFGWAKALVAFFAKLADPSFWIRVLEMLAGGVLFLVGLYLLVRQVGLTPPNIPRPTRRVAEAA